MTSVGGRPWRTIVARPSREPRRYVALRSQRLDHSGEGADSKTGQITPRVRTPGKPARGDENEIIIPVKWCSLVSLSIKAWCPLSLHRAEKILDKRDPLRKRLNESPLRHQPAVAR